MACKPPELEQAIFERRKDVVDSWLHSVFEEATFYAAFRLKGAERDDVLADIAQFGAPPVLAKMAEENGELRTDEHPFWDSFFRVLGSSIWWLSDEARIHVASTDKWADIYPAFKVATQSFVKAKVREKPPILAYLAATCFWCVKSDWLLVEIMEQSQDWVAVLWAAYRLQLVLQKDDSLPYWEISRRSLEKIKAVLPRLRTAFGGRAPLIRTISDLALAIEKAEADGGGQSERMGKKGNEKGSLLN